MNAPRHLALVSLLSVAACGGPADEPLPTEEAATAGDEEPPVWTGSVSERAFMELHQHTDDEAPMLEGQTVEVAGTEAYLALPEGEARAAVLVIHEWWGLNDHIRHYADRIASQGFAALAVDLYGGEVATTPEDAMRLMRGVDEARAHEILEAGVALLRDGPQSNAERVGVVGWCFGGGWSLEAGLTVSGIDAIAMYYGRPVVDPERLHDLPGPLLGVFANRDTSIPPAQVDRFEAALDEAGATHRIVRYHAHHAFANPSSARYEPESASAAWEEVRAFFARHLLELED